MFALYPQALGFATVEAVPMKLSSGVWLNGIDIRQYTAESGFVEGRTLLNQIL